MTSQLVIFRAFLFILRPPDPRSKKISCKSTNKKILALDVLPYRLQTVLIWLECFSMMIHCIS